jgi:hypothetical protein
MDHIVWFVLQVLDSVTFGWFSRGDSRHGQLPDPDEVWDEERRRLGRERIERDALVGRIGTALTPLRPVGVVELDGRRHEAVSETGFIEAGRTIEVIGRNDFALIVRASRP